MDSVRINQERVQIKRRTPYKRLKIENITRSEVIKDNEDRWHLVSHDGSYLFRVWIVGVVTEKYEGENNYIGLKIEDGSGAIRLKSWDQSLESVKQWDQIEVLGQIQISEQENLIDVFITPDIFEPITDDNWILYHRLKVLQTSHKSSTNGNIQPTVVSGVDLGIASLEDLKIKLKDLVKSLDKGTGVTMDIIIENLPNVDESQIYEAITELLESGEFFEPQVGIYSIAFE